MIIEVLLITGEEHRRPLLQCLRRLTAGQVSVLTPAGLSCEGWVHDPHSTGEDTVVIDRRVLPTTALAGVITALDYVQPFDLAHVHPDDQPFVAQEMTAFLRSWLAGLTCPVTDRPTPTALSGSAADPSVWFAAAATIGICDRRWLPCAPGRRRTVTVVDGSVVDGSSIRLGAVDAVTEAALELVKAAGISAARLVFLEPPAVAGRPGCNGLPALVSAEPWWYRPADSTVAAMLSAMVSPQRASAAVGR